MYMKDEALIDELKKRLDDKNKALVDLRSATKNLEQVNKKLQESEKLKSDFLSNIRNEINNPLTVMVALSAELGSMKSCEEKKFKGLAAMLHKEALILDFQMRNILTAAELEAGESYLHITKVNVQSVIDDCVNSFRPFIDENGLKIKRVGPSPMWANTDSEKLYSILSNIINNAIIFNKEGGLIEITVGESEGVFTCSIRDEGIGIAKGDQKVIFDSFKQLDMGMRKKYRGHGIGLSVVMAAINLLEGSISVKSAPDKGSTFTLEIPVRSEEETEGVSTEGMEFFTDDEQEF